MKPKVDILSIPDGKDMLKNYKKHVKRKASVSLRFLMWALRGLFVSRPDRFSTGYVIDSSKGGVTFYIKGKRAVIISKGLLLKLKEVVDA
jgi:hypothetical protein